MTKASQFCDWTEASCSLPHAKERAPAWLQRELNHLQAAFGLSEVELVDLLLDEVERRQQPIVQWWGKLLAEAETWEEVERLKQGESNGDVDRSLQL